MIVVKNRREKMKTLCRDCTENPNTCKKNPKECAREANLYFKEYENSVGWTT